MYSEKLLRRLAERIEGLRPFPIPGWVHNGHWIVRSNAIANGRPINDFDKMKVMAWLDDHLNAEQEPLEHVGFMMNPYWANDPSTERLCRLYEGPGGVVAIDDEYDVLLDKLTPVQLCVDTREVASVGGVDKYGELQCWIKPVKFP